LFCFYHKQKLQSTVNELEVHLDSTKQMIDQQHTIITTLEQEKKGIMASASVRCLFGLFVCFCFFLVIQYAFLLLR
jgi:hypothetical protein